MASLFALAFAVRLAGAPGSCLDSSYRQNLIAKRSQQSSFLLERQLLVNLVLLRPTLSLFGQDLAQPSPTPAGRMTAMAQMATEFGLPVDLSNTRPRLKELMSPEAEGNSSFGPKIAGGSG